MKKPLTHILCLSIAGLALAPAQGQSYDFLIVERNQLLSQTGVNMTEAPAWTFENGGNGNFYFLASAEITGSTPATFSVTNGVTNFPFSYEPVSLIQLQPYFYDGFDVSASGFDINTELARQGGGDAPLQWVANVADQATDYHQQVVGPVLQLAGDGVLPSVLVSPDLNFTTKWNDINLGGKKIQMVMDAFANQSGTEYFSQAALTVASNAPLAEAGEAGSGFSLVFIEDAFNGAGNIIQIWDGDTILANDIPNPAGAAGAFVEIFLDDPSDGDPWNGVGSTVVLVRVEGTEIFKYEKTGGGYTANYVTLEGFMQSVGAQLATHTFEDFTVFWGTTEGSSIPTTTEVEVEESFPGAAELASAIPAGNYDFVSNAGTVATIPVGNIAIPEAQPVKEYELLQFLDASFDLTISWDPYIKNPAADDAILTIEAVYYDDTTLDDVLVWEAPRTREGDLLPGIDPTATFVTIPAGTFAGSPDGRYTINIFYSDVMSLETDGNTKVWLETVELDVPVQIQMGRTDWAGYPIIESGFVNTGEFLGWLNVDFAGQGWVYNLDLRKYTYVLEQWVTEAGTWMYIPQ